MMIKQKLQSAWNWTKEKVKKFKKWIIALLIPVALAAPLIIEPILYPVGKITAPENNTYKIGVLNYDAVLAEDITADQPLKYQLDDKYISFKPIEMRWDKSSFKTIKPKQAKISKKNYLYENAFGEGIDIDMNFGERVFEKIVKINSLEDLGEIPDGAEYLEIEFKVKTNFVVDGWNKKDRFEITDKIRLGDFSYIEPAMAWDSYSEEVCETKEVCEIFDNKVQIEGYLEKEKLVKRIPVEWLKTAQFPVYTDVDIAYGTAQEFEAGATWYISVTDIDTNKFVTCFMDDSDGEAGKCRVGSVSGTTITYGDVSEHTSDVYGALSVGDVCKLDTNKFVVVYSDALSENAEGRASTVTDEGIDGYGPVVNFTATDAEFITCAQLDTDKFVICYNDEGDSDTGWCHAASVSGTTITKDADPGRVALDGNGGNTTDYYPLYSDTAQLDTDKFVTCFASAEDGYDGKCVVGTTTSTDITFGTVAEFEANGCIYIGVESPAVDKFVVSYEDYSVGVTGDSRAATVATRTITYGTEASHDSSANKNNKVAPIDATHVVVVFADDNDALAGKSNYLTVDFSDRSISVSTPEEFEAGGTGGATDLGMDTALISSDKIVICYQDDGDADKGKCIIGDTPSVAAARRIFIVD